LQSLDESIKEHFFAMVDNEISEKRLERGDEKWFPDRKGLTIFKDKNLKKFCD
jgi:hypothetical protein